MFKVGDKIKLVTKDYGDTPNNPFWGGRYGSICGVINNIVTDDGLNIKVSWDNGCKNSYRKSDLQLLKARAVINQSSNNQKQSKMKKVVQDIDKVDVQVSQECTSNGFYGLLTKSKKTYFLIRANSKWVWASAGSETNYTKGDSDFKTAMDRALEFDDNVVVLMDTKDDLFQFMSNPAKYYNSLP
mgnify:CR=1 FL=1|tara:strand:- start:45904 stop:46458 length:555 start_codon:yes stop_codon:yes gene_type:complete